MPAKKTGSSVPKTPATKPQKSESMKFGGEHKKDHLWFKELCATTISSAKETERGKLKKGHAKLSETRLAQVAGQHAKHQAAINSLSKRQKRLADRLKSQYGHTGVTKVQSLHGETLIATKAEVKIDVANLLQTIGTTRFLSVALPALDLNLLLTEADKDDFLKEAIKKSLFVDIGVSVTAPDSRRGKSGKVDED
jgi:hypothetical protein